MTPASTSFRLYLCKMLSGLWFGLEGIKKVDTRLQEPYADHLQDFLVAPIHIVETRCVNQNDMATVCFMVQNPKSSNILGDGLKGIFSTPSRLASEQVNNLRMLLAIIPINFVRI